MCNKRFAQIKMMAMVLLCPITVHAVKDDVVISPELSISAKYRAKTPSSASHAGQPSEFFKDLNKLDDLNAAGNGRRSKTPTSASRADIRKQEESRAIFSRHDSCDSCGSNNPLDLYFDSEIVDRVEYYLQDSQAPSPIPNDPLFINTPRMSPTHAEQSILDFIGSSNFELIDYIVPNPTGFLPVEFSNIPPQNDGTIAPPSSPQKPVAVKPKVSKSKKSYLNELVMKLALMTSKQYQQKKDEHVFPEDIMNHLNKLADVQNEIDKTDQELNELGKEIYEYIRLGRACKDYWKNTREMKEWALLILNNQEVLLQEAKIEADQNVNNAVVTVNIAIIIAENIMDLLDQRDALRVTRARSKSRSDSLSL